MKPCFVCLVCLAFSAVSASQPAVAGTIYDVASDWSFASNPNGPWSYNQGNTPLEHIQVNWGGVIGETFWSNSPSGTTPPAWTHAATSQSGANDWQPGDVIGHSTNQPNVPALGLGNVKWVSPGDGTVSITGFAWDAMHLSGRNSNWSLSVASEVIAELDTGVFGIVRTDGAADFANNLLAGKLLSNLVVAQGDVVMFEIEATSADGHFVGVDMQIDFVPEPSTLCLLALGSVAMLRRRRMG